MAARAGTLTLISGNFMENASMELNDRHCQTWSWVEEGCFRNWESSHIQDGRQGKHLNFGFRSYKGERQAP